MTRSEALQEIDYLRTLAEEGRSAPLLGGGHLAAYGALTTLAYLGHWSVLAFHLPPTTFALVWSGYAISMMIAGFLMNRRIRTRPGSGSIGNRIERSVWFAAGLGIFAAFIGAAVRSVVKANGAEMDLIAPVVFAAYATGLLTTGRIVGNRALIAAATLAYAFAGAAVALVFTPTLYLVTAAGAFATLVVPGLILMRREPSEIV
jgi:hypothetical protein